MNFSSQNQSKSVAMNESNHHYGSFSTPEDPLCRTMSNYRNNNRSFILPIVSIVIISIFSMGCFSLYSNVITQNEIMMKMQLQIEQLSTTKMSNKNKCEMVDMKLQAPPKFSVKHMTPRKFQDHRGTCWDFGSVGVLEQTYRAQGIENGWLKPDEYVALSEQAYGAEVLRICTGNGKPSNAPQRSCREPGAGIWQNSTEGGEAYELYYLVDSLKDNVYPESICPYIPIAGNDTSCLGLTPEKRKRNPLLFTIEKMETYYDEVTAKRKLFEKKQAMAFTTAMPYITHYYPCIGEFKNDPRCDENSNMCTLCPKELTMTTCCVPLPGGQNFNMKGEFISHRGMTIEGGHVMVLAGYNDVYHTKQGFTGGYILKNSWHDGTNPPLGPPIPRASHSIKYWMQEISDWEERTICPNSGSPYSWYQCGNSGEVTISSSYEMNATAIAEQDIEFLNPFNRSNAFREGVDACLANETKLFAAVNVQPLELRCTDARYCNVSDNFVYYARNMTEWGDEMSRICLFEYKKDLIKPTSRDFCLPPLLVYQIARIFSPLEQRRNDPDRCGYYFYPYQVQHDYVALFEGFYVNHFEIKWHPQSYVANSHHYKHLDYSDIKKSTKTQRKDHFVGPFPFATAPKSFSKKEDSIISSNL